jgi:hypothetical protein
MDPAYENDQTIVLHELLHERGLIDLYAYAISLGRSTGSRVEIRENGRLVAGSALMPDLTPASGTTTLYRSPANGLMGTRYRKGASLTEHSAFGLNLIAGRRTPRWFDSWGNPQSLGNTPQPGSYANLIPERTLLRLRDEDGRPVPGAQVAVHLDHGVLTYQDVYLETPDLVLSTDLDGWVELPGELLAGLPSTTTQPPKALVAILGVFTPQARGFAFLPIYDLNLLYIQGNRQVAEAELSVTLQPY